MLRFFTDESSYTMHTISNFPSAHSTKGKGKTPSPGVVDGSSVRARSIHFPEWIQFESNVLVKICYCSYSRGDDAHILRCFLNFFCALIP